MRKPSLTHTVVDGLNIIVGLAIADMQADDKRNWGNAGLALKYIGNLRKWYYNKHHCPQPKALLDSITIGFCRNLNEYGS